MNDNPSFIMAERLKELRGDLSHNKLRLALFERYGIEISRYSLMNYEAQEHHSKEGANNGMRVEVLRCLADFYGVSSDYILGLTDVKTPSAEVQAVISYTGLSEENALTLCKMREGSAQSIMSGNSDKEEIINASEPYLNCLNDLLSAIGEQREAIIRDYMLIRYFADGIDNYDPNYFDEKRETDLLEHGHTSIPVRTLIEHKSCKIARAIEKYLLNKYAAIESE